MRQFTFIAAIVATVAILFIATKPASAAAIPQSKGGAAAAFAKLLVAADSVGVTTFGGKGTVSIIELVTTPGSATVTFTGKYPKGLTADQVVLNVTTEPGELAWGVPKWSAPVPLNWSFMSPAGTARRAPPRPSRSF